MEYLAARFQAVVEGDWGKLLAILESDKEASERIPEARRRRRGRQGEEGMERKTEVVFDLVAKSLVGRRDKHIHSSISRMNGFIRPLTKAKKLKSWQNKKM